MEIIKMEKNRRGFFKMLGLGAVGASIASVNPVKSLSKSLKSNHTNRESKVKVNIHPNAIKRNNRG